ncbi:MAG: glycoside hydrolase family 55 protein [Epibacterium sp.]|nr:glycoside hydrolase family 55 protein [Epibacterium sp.]NQX74261.1 hypothetical protein [Epibacterium sp.]
MPNGTLIDVYYGDTNGGDVAPSIVVNSIAVIEALSDPTAGDAVYLNAGGRSGWFNFDDSDLSSEVGADTQQGIYIAPDADATGASGAWVRQYDGTVNVKWFGAAGDGLTDDAAAFQAAIDSDAGTVFVPAGVYIIKATLTFTGTPPNMIGDGSRYNQGLNTRLRIDHPGDGIFVNGTSHISTHFQDMAIERTGGFFDQGANINFDGQGGVANIVAAVSMSRVYVRGGQTGIRLRGVINAAFRDFTCSEQSLAGIYFDGSGVVPASNNIECTNFNIYQCTTSGAAGIRYAAGTDCGRNHVFRNGSVENCHRPIIIDAGDICQNVQFQDFWFEFCSNPITLAGGRRITFQNIRNAQAGIDLIDPNTFGAEDVIFDGCMGASTTALLGTSGISVHEFERGTAGKAASMSYGPLVSSTHRGNRSAQAIFAGQVAGTSAISALNQSGTMLQNFLDNWDIGGTAQWTKPGGVTAASDPLGGMTAWSIDASQSIFGARDNIIPDNAVGVFMQLAVWVKGVGEIEIYNRGDGFAHKMNWNINSDEWVRLPLSYVTKDASTDRCLGFYANIIIDNPGDITIWRPGVYAGNATIDSRPKRDPLSAGFEAGWLSAYPALCERVGGNLVFQGASPPASGAYLVGDKVVNTQPAASGNIGWVCTTAGSPGTWKTYGSIAA